MLYAIRISFGAFYMLPQFLVMSRVTATFFYRRCIKEIIMRLSSYTWIFIRKFTKFNEVIINLEFAFLFRVLCIHFAGATLDFEGTLRFSFV